MQRTHLVPVVLSRWPSRRQGLHWGSVSGASSNDVTSTSGVLGSVPGSG